MRRGRPWWFAVVLVVAAGCSGDGDTVGSAPTVGVPPTNPAPSVVSTLPLAAEALDDPDVTTAATDLAPSQIDASTVPEPPTPDPCALADLALWTARVEPRDGDTTRLADAVIRVRNVGDEWCEPDIGRSPLLDPAVEPDVWLLPGDEADLYVGQREPDCASPTVVSLAQVAIGRDSTVVPSAAISCEWWLNAFVPLDPPERRCEPSDLEVAITERAVVVRTIGPPCGIGGLTVADGGQAIPPVERPPSPVRVLRPGDVAMLAVLDRACDGQPAGVRLDFAGSGEVLVDDVPCSARWVTGPPDPWFGTPEGPLDGIGGLELDVDAAIDALDPFG